MRTSRILLPRFMCLAITVFLGVLGGGEVNSAEFKHTFAQGLEHEPMLGLKGPNAELTVRTDSIGLQIRLLESRPQLAPVGVSAKFSLRGDFDVSASYRILQADRPAKGPGVGARMFMRFDSPSHDVISLSRMLRPTEGKSFLAYHIRATAKGEQEHDFRIAEAASASGRLRLVREGPTLSFHVSDNQKDFRELHTVEVGTGDVTEFLLTATTSAERCGAVVRWDELKVQADQLPSKVFVASNTWSIWWVGAVVGIIILATAGAVTRYRPSRDRA